MMARVRIFFYATKVEFQRIVGATVFLSFLSECTQSTTINPIIQKSRNFFETIRKWLTYQLKDRECVCVCVLVCMRKRFLFEYSIHYSNYFKTNQFEFGKQIVANIVQMSRLVKIFARSSNLIVLARKKTFLRTLF